MSESIQHRLSRVRPPRVQITYDVEVGGAFQKKELPFILGILADLSGQPETPLPRLKERKFVQIDRDNFDLVMEAIAPRLAVRVPNRLQAESQSMINVLLSFKKFSDFNPVSVVRQIAPLRELYEARGRLRDLLAKLDGNDDLDAILTEIAAHPDEQAKLRDQLKALGHHDGPPAASTAGATATNDKDGTPGANAEPEPSPKS